MNNTFARSSLSPRIASLKERYLRITPTISINRARAFTEIAQKKPNAPIAIRRAMSFKRACETAPLYIAPDELVVGHPCGKPRAGSFSPDIAWRWLEEELDTIDTRSQDPYYISPEDKDILRTEIFPYWKNRSLDEACESLFRSAGLWEFSAEACVSDLTYHHTSGGGDTSPGYDIILLEKGVLQLKIDAEKALTKAEENETDKKSFYQAAILCCEGILCYSKRLSDYLSELALGEQDTTRRLELEHLSAICAHVPAHTPQTFHQALQAIWTIQSLFLLEENQCSTSLGRFDQYLLPFYQNDIDKNTLNREQAQELLSCFILKCSEMIWYTPGATAKYFAGYMPFINLCVGGQKREGGDATNDLTYLIMDAVASVGVYQPSLACRIHNSSPIPYLQKIVDVIETGMGMPACHFDDAHIKMMLRKGFSFDDARDYSLMGCVEPQRSGRIHQWTAGGFTQWPIAIEFVFSRGFMPSHGSQQGIDTGSLANLTSYAEFEAAVHKQLDHIIAQTAKGSLINQELVRDHNPSPYMSLWVEGCMESGKDLSAGGAVLYDGPGTIFAGLGTYADSMAAVKKLVFDEKKYSLEEFKNALENDWKGHELLHNECNKSPKFGNDDDYVDTIARDIVDYTEKQMNRHKSLYAKMIHGTLSQSFNTPLGELVGATPNGRNSGAPLSDGMSPSQGADIQGPTAVIKSVSKINVEAMSLGMSHNFKLLKGSLEKTEGRESLISLLQTSSTLGNAQMQFNYLDVDTLQKAQAHPDEYRGLMVRVAGYSAFFVELCKEVQDEIISRTILFDDK